jgi:hypothetical protein
VFCLPPGVGAAGAPPTPGSGHSIVATFAAIRAWKNVFT